jgi:hypothetical protein
LGVLCSLSLSLSFTCELTILVLLMIFMVHSTLLKKCFKLLPSLRYQLLNLQLFILFPSPLLLITSLNHSNDKVPRKKPYRDSDIQIVHQLNFFCKINSNVHSDNIYHGPSKPLVGWTKHLTFLASCNTAVVHLEARPHQVT